MRFFSPAKLNLFFRILGIRADGYHEIASLMQAIDVGDWISIEENDRDLLTCSDPSLPCDHTNLIVKALNLFKTRTTIPPVKIHLEKQIPMQAGLGGGSSNAATVLWGLNGFATPPLSLEELILLGAKLGSDVPFFFSLGSAFCTGRGEIFESFSLPPLQGTLEKPPYGLSTQEVYRAVRLHELADIDVRKVLQGFSEGKPYFFNDLEQAAFRVEPRLRTFKQALLMRFETVSMTGSGTAFFCFSDQPSVRSIIRAPLRWYKE